MAEFIKPPRQPSGARIKVVKNKRLKKNLQKEEIRMRKLEQKRYSAETKAAIRQSKAQYKVQVNQAKAQKFAAKRAAKNAKPIELAKEKGKTERTALRAASVADIFGKTSGTVSSVSQNVNGGLTNTSTQRKEDSEDDQSDQEDNQKYKVYRITR